MPSQMNRSYRVYAGFSAAKDRIVQNNCIPVFAGYKDRVGGNNPTAERSVLDYLKKLKTSNLKIQGNRM
jgi:hypothetical protein